MSQSLKNAEALYLNYLSINSRMMEIPFTRENLEELHENAFGFNSICEYTVYDMFSEIADISLKDDDAEAIAEIINSDSFYDLWDLAEVAGILAA